MTEVTEQEAREAARIRAELIESIGGQVDAVAAILNKDAVQSIHDSEGTLADWAMQQLASIDSERAERAKPITPEWCLANGAKKRGTGFFAWETATKYVCVHVMFTAPLHVDVGGQIMDGITTCGQLSDLLNALKGVAK